MTKKCQGKNCRDRNQCYRYRSRAATQDWDNYDEQRTVLMCEWFLPLENHRDIEPADWLDVRDGVLVVQDKRCRPIS